MTPQSTSILVPHILRPTACSRHLPAPLSCSPWSTLLGQIRPLSRHLVSYRSSFNRNPFHRSHSLPPHLHSNLPLSIVHPLQTHPTPLMQQHTIPTRRHLTLLQVCKIYCDSLPILRTSTFYILTILHRYPQPRYPLSTPFPLTHSANLHQCLKHPLSTSQFLENEVCTLQLCFCCPAPYICRYLA